MSVTRGALPRRPPLTRGAAERYHALVRQSRLRRRPRRSAAAALIAWPLLVVIGLAVLGQGMSGAGAMVASLGRDFDAAVRDLFPAAVATSLDIERAALVGSADPILDLPSFSRDAAVMLQGRIPTFALAAGRRVEVALNGVVAGRGEPDGSGRFAQRLTLRAGDNAVVVTLLDGPTKVSSTSATIVLDTIPPTLAVVRPRPGETVEGPTVVIEGRTEAGARITVNDRLVVAAPDGTFSEAFTAPAGALTVEVVATDPAGNATRTSFPITVKERAVTAGQRVVVSLDRTRVRPGQAVVAEVTVTDDGRARADVVVSLFVGVVEIGSSRTDRTGLVRIGFAAPTTEGEIGIVAIASQGSGRATLTVAR